MTTLTRILVLVSTLTASYTLQARDSFFHRNAERLQERYDTRDFIYSHPDNNNFDQRGLRQDRLHLRLLSGQHIEMSLGGSGAHGGDYNEIPIHNLGWQILEDLKETQPRLDHVVDLHRYVARLKNLKITIVDQVTLNSYQREAVNIPDENLWYLTRDSYHFLLDQEVPYQERAQFFLHEFLPLLGVDDSGYQTSQLIASRLSSRQGSMTQVLVNHFFDHNSSGVAFEEVRRACHALKRRYQEQYFAVYCLYKEKYFKEFISHTTVYGLMNWHLGWYRFNAHSTRRFSYRDPIYGLKVIGLGPKELLTKRTIVTSDALKLSPFEREKQAKLACTMIIAREDDSNFKFYQARCEVYQQKKGYKFNIVTMNPFI